MTISVVRAHAASARLAHARDWLARSEAKNAIILASSRAAADELLRSACPPGGGVIGVDRATLHQLAAELAAPTLATEGRAPIAGLGLEALCARAVVRARDDEPLGYFQPVADLPGFARALATTLLDLRVQDLRPEALRVGASEGDPGRDLARLLEGYEAELETWRLVDAAGRLRRAREALREGRGPWHDRPILLLDVAIGGRRERDFLAALAERAPAMLATVLTGDEETRRHLEGALGTTVTDLPEPSAPRRLARLRTDLFRAELASRPSDDEADAGGDQSLAFFSSPGEARECVEIVRRIRDLAAGNDRDTEDGLPFDRTAILLRDPTHYLPLVEEALRRAEIPGHFSRGTVRPHPGGRALLALLACAAEGLSASRFAEYLSLGQVPPLDDAGAPPEVPVPWIEADGDQLVFTSSPSTDPEPDPLDVPEIETLDPEDAWRDPVLEGSLRTPRNWERLLVDAAVVGGRDRWAGRLEGLANELRRRREALDGDDEAAQRGLDDALAGLAHLRRFALPVVDLLAKLPDRALWGDWLDRLEALAARVLRAPSEVLAALAELRPMADVGPVGIDDVRRILAPRLSLLRTEPSTRRYGRVFVATLEEARGLAFDAVFVPGLADGVFPRRSWEDPLLLDEARRRLEAGLATRDTQVERERVLLRVAAGAAIDRLVVSYPNLDSRQGRARVPSFYALDVLRAADGRLPDLRRLEARAAAETASILGWPAPRDPARAIDDAEYDLAVLEPLVRRASREDGRGRARYLLASNDHLDRALRRRWQRWRGGFTAADGLVDPQPATLAVLEEHRLRARSHSPTTLQRYAECPYRFLLHGVHRLRTRDVAVSLEQLDPLTRGKLFHEVQQELLGALREEDDMLPIRDDNVARVAARVDQVLDRVAEAYRDELAPAIPRVWASEIEGLRTDLHGWIRHVADADEAWLPSHFELAFGLPFEARDPASQADDAVTSEGYRLKGSIDLVEHDRARDVLRVTDHKTGKVRVTEPFVVGGGEALQPLLYALAAERVLDRPVEAGRLFYCTRKGGFQSPEVRADDEARREVTQVLDTVDRAVTDGFLPAAPREGACRWCDYTLVCGPNEEQRLRVKIGTEGRGANRRQQQARQRLEPLLQLRRRP